VVVFVAEVKRRTAELGGGLLPAALSTGIGSDTQRPFAIVIVAGLISRLFIGFFVNPVLYEMVAREGDVLQV
jgi:heavy metal efflux system protein